MGKRSISYLAGIMLFAFSLCYSNANAGTHQDTLVLSLDETIELAVDSSLNAFIAENLYLSAYWQYNTYQAQRLPFLDLNARPADYSRSVAQEYIYEQNTYQYIEKQTLSSNLNLSLTQNIPQTGGSVYIDSDIGRLENFGDHQYLQYSSVPLRVGLRQPLFAYNRFKWEKKIEPLKYERAKHELVEDMEEIAVKAVDLFFELANAQVNLQIAKTQKANADTLLNIGKQRFDLASISREDLYMLELEKVQANTNLERAKSQYKRAQMNLNSYLRLDSETNIEIILPEDIPELQIPASKSIELAKDNHPKMLELEEDTLKSKSDVERTKRESRFNAELNVSFGLNQRAEDLYDAYRDPTTQQIVQLGISIPILDWGTARGKHQLAKHDHRVVLAHADQAREDFLQNVILTTEEFNRQEKYVEDAVIADSIASEVYRLTLERFIAGQADIIRLQNAQEASISARVRHINALRDYWYYYYNMRRMTLYDFLNDNSLAEDFEEKIGVDL